VDKRNVIESLTRISANGNNAGMNLIISTQRPSSNIITNDIKINICTRIAFFVPSIYDSKAILDVVGAEKLNKKGDMLLIGRNRPLTMIHGAYITDDEIEKVIRFVSSQMLPQYEEIRIINEVLDKAIDVTNKSKKASDDPLYNEMLDYAIRAGSISASKLQRQFGVGFNRASKIIDEFEADGIVGPQKGSKPREVLIKMEGATPDPDE
jgi:S-DNA-T family DNA segregation ATPase FtsK/SpoIIIE